MNALRVARSRRLESHGRRDPVAKPQIVRRGWQRWRWSEGGYQEPPHWVLEWTHAGVKYHASFGHGGRCVWVIDDRWRAAGGFDLPPELAGQLRAALSAAAAAALVELVFAPDSPMVRRNQLRRRFHQAEERLLRGARELVAGPPEVFDEACQAIERLEAISSLATPAA